MITITWWDGSLTTGATFEETERALRAAQWSDYPTRTAFRTDLKHRCKVWAGVRPSLPKATSENFIRALEASGLCRVDVEDDDSNDQVINPGTEGEDV